MDFKNFTKKTSPLKWSYKTMKKITHQSTTIQARTDRLRRDDTTTSLYLGSWQGTEYSASRTVRRYLSTRPLLHPIYYPPLPPGQPITFLHIPPSLLLWLLLQTSSSAVSLPHRICISITQISRNKEENNTCYLQRVTWINYRIHWNKQKQVLYTRADWTTKRLFNTMQHKLVR